MFVEEAGLICRVDHVDENPMMLIILHPRSLDARRKVINIQRAPEPWQLEQPRQLPLSFHQLAKHGVKRVLEH